MSSLHTARTMNTNFPAQKKSYNYKKNNKQWGRDCIDSAESLALFRNPLIRQSYNNKLTNYNLVNDILDQKDIERVCNPMGFANTKSSIAKMQNYPIAVPKIDLLIGEERKRRFNWTVKVINEEAISQKEQEKKEEWNTFIDNILKEEPNLSDSELNKKVETFQKYMNYEWQDLRERRANHLLNYLWKTLDLKEIFSRGFEDVLIASEEIYCVDIVDNSPTIRKCNTLNIHTIRSGESSWINDADIILEDGFLSPGQIIDRFHEHLTDKQVNDLEEGSLFTSNESGVSIGEKEPDLMLDEYYDSESIASIDDEISNQFGGAFDDEGNIRVLRVVWKSKRKIGRLSYIDKDGDLVEEIIDERYTKKEGDTIKWEWISEWWEGTRIGGSIRNNSHSGIYINIKRRSVQYRSMHNISKCHSGYIGLAYNVNTSKAKSLMDRMKPYQYLYNVFMYRTELAFAKAKGRIAKLDISKKPASWKVEDWLYYAEVNGWLLENPFNEGNKGAAQGKLSGQMSGSSSYIDLDLGNYIQQHVQMLQFLEGQLGQIAGVSRQREGQIENRETVRGVERAVSQSSHITEKWFQLHELVKKEVLGVLLETAKHAWKGQKKKLSYVTDEASNIIFEIDGDELIESDYGIVVSNTSDDMELMQSLKELSHAGLQNDKLTFSQLMDIYMNPSLSSMRRKIEQGEQDKIKRDQETQQMQQQQVEMQIKAEAEKQDKEMGHDITKIHEEYDRKEDLELLKTETNMTTSMYSKAVDKDLDNDGILDYVEIEKEQIRKQLEELKLKQQELIENKKLEHQKQENKKDRDLEKYKIDKQTKYKTKETTNKK